MKMASRHPGAKARRLAASRGRARGFTLVELMIAVSVLIVIIIATSKIFGTAGKVTSLGQATADVLQETTAIERQIRSDFERLAQDGVFAIRCVSVRNDINVSIGPLLNPALPEDAMIRADQLLFFTNTVQGTQVYIESGGSNHKHQATAARIYYGPAFQVPGAEILTVPADAAINFNNGVQLFPWSQDPAPPSLEMFDPITGASVGTVDGTQPLASQWLLARQSVLLADDGGGTDFFLSSFTNSTAAIWDAAIRNSRRDIAASQLNDVRNAVTNFGNYDWPTQRFNIGNRLLFYPRAERVAPSMARLDHSLTTNVLAGACSSFIIDWTYEEGVGAAFNDQGTFFAGFDVDTDPATGSPEHPWFGLDSDVDGNGDPDRGVFTYDSVTWWTGADTIFFQNIEQYDPPGTVPVEVYEAIFGYNRDTPLDPTTGQPWDLAATGVGYTPWPSAIRITMVLHDPATKLEVGREVQFVMNLPKRVQ
ncbi:MAG: prepilin-type N-terminal cleavage/methylation domain-containing protein [Phycisphaerales bacterium]